MKEVFIIYDYKGHIAKNIAFVDRKLAQIEAKKEQGLHVESILLPHLVKSCFISRMYKLGCDFKNNPIYFDSKIYTSVKELKNNSKTEIIEIKII